MTLKEEKSSNAFFNDSAILFIYGITFLTYCAGFWLRDQHYIMLLPIICFIGYDYWFTYKNKKAWGDAGRCKSDTLDSIRSASTYTSYFLAFVALSISLLSEGPDIAKSINMENFWIQIYILLILSLSGIILLFIPVTYKMKYEEKKEDERPSKALKNCFFVVLLSEKIVITLIIYLIIVLLGSEQSSSITLQLNL
ncbi:MAG: hypothetical protein CL663_03355 [Bacteroidetes bacterium]|nr:hypothetical protein [Bacteroidota bacterium]